MNFICETLVYAKKNYYLCRRKAASRHNCSSKLGKFCSRFAFSLHRVKKNGSAHRDSDTRVRQIFLWRAVSLRRFATQCVTINNS